VAGRAGRTGIAREFSDVVPGVVVGAAVPIVLDLLDGGGLRSLRPPGSVPSPGRGDRGGASEGDEGTPGGLLPQTVEDRTESTTTQRSVLLALVTVVILLLALAVLFAGVSLGIVVAVVAWLLLVVLAARWARVVSDVLRDMEVQGRQEARTDG
jgi:hypothetical protein